MLACCYWSGFAITALDELGGVGCPVAACGSDPVDGGGRSDAEQVGEDGGWEVAGEVDEGGRRPAMAGMPMRRSRCPRYGALSGCLGFSPGNSHGLSRVGATLLFGRRLLASRVMSVASGSGTWM